MTDHAAAQPTSGGLMGRWQRTPLYLRILAGVVLGVLIGLALGRHAGFLATPSRLVLRLLSALAPPLILLAVVQALMHAQIPKRQGAHLIGLLILNTLVAIGIGLLVANVVQPGRGSKLNEPQQQAAKEVEKAAAQPRPVDPLTLFLDNVPKSLLGPFTDEGKVIAVIMLAVAFGIALRRLKHEPVATAGDLVNLAFRTLIILLHWIIEVIPFAVLGIVASIIGVKGFRDFISLGWFVIAVLVALLLQATYYLVRIWWWSWVTPVQVLRGTRDALVMAFSTASSTATMPVTYSCLRTRVGLREQSASLGALVGANFNNDGTALYEAMAALFVSQMLGMNLSLQQQFLVVLTSVIASVGAAGIPEAGLVTMTLVLHAIGVPPEQSTQYIAVLLTVDWFLDRCRTAINVMGDVNVSCLLDGRHPEPKPRHADEPRELAVMTE